MSPFEFYLKKYPIKHHILKNYDTQLHYNMTNNGTAYGPRLC